MQSGGAILHKTRRNTWLFLLLGVLCLMLFLADLSWGYTTIPLNEVLAIFGGKGNDMLNAEILLNLRLPRAITAIIAGIGLPIAGLMMQTLFRNALAGPYILGVSSGATLGVALVMMSGTLLGMSVMGHWIAIAAAIAGALLVLLLVLGVSFKVRSAVSLLIVGIMFGSIAGALVNVIQQYSNPDALKLFIVWSFGSLSSVDWSQMQVLAPIFLVGLTVAFALIKPLNGFLLGENYAQGLGISVTQTRLLIVVATGVLAGGITAFTGPIAFIGVAVPHIARGLFQTGNHRTIMPATGLCGIALMLVCDIVSQTSTYTLPISTVSALFGAPIIIWIILKRKQ